MSKTNMTISKRAAFNAAASLACAAALGAAAGCAKHDAGAASASSPQPLPVTAQAVRVGTLTSTFALTGTVVPARQANLASVISGTVREVTVQIGDRVSAGQLLVQIDDSTLQAQLAQDEATLTEARARLRQTTATNHGMALTTSGSLRSAQVAYQTAVADNRRNESLFKQGYISQQAIDKSRSDLAVAQAALESAQVAAQNANMSSDQQSSAAQADVASMAAAVTVDEAAVQSVGTQIAQAAVKAPFDGIVTQRNVDPGSLASPGAQLVQVSQLNPAYVNVGVPDGDLQYVRAGSDAVVRIDALAGRTWHGSVNNLNAAAGEGTLTYLARIALPNADSALKAGMVANVTFVSARNQGALIVPRGAVASTDNGTAVYVVLAGKAKLRPVTVGLETQNDAQISGKDIAKGTIVITQRPDALQDGSPVKVVASN
jgi:HlyD family secretion protein